MILKIMLFSALLIFNLNSIASTLIYQPVNPSFGGNPLNGPFLLRSAELQDDHKPPSSGSRSSPNTAAERLKSRLDSVIASQLASSILKNVIDDDGNLSAGSVETDSFTVSVTEIGNSFIINLDDKVTGESSEITITD